MNESRISFNFFPFLFTLLGIWESIRNFLVSNERIIFIFGSIAGIVVIFIIFPYRKTLRLLRNVKNSIFRNAKENYHYLNIYVHFIPFYIKGKESYELKKIFKNKKTKVIVITGDVEGGKKYLLEKFLSGLQTKRIKLKNYHLLRYDLRNIKSKEDLISRISNDLKERGRERLHRYLNEGHPFDEIQKTLIQELNLEPIILFLKNLNPHKHEDILDVISSTMWFYDKTKVIIISETCPEKFSTDRLHEIVKVVNVNYYNLVQVKQILDEHGIRYSFENITEIKEITKGCPEIIKYFISLLKKRRIYDLTANKDWISIFYEPKMKTVKQKIVNKRYDRVYLRLEEDMRIIPQILSALYFPCTLEDLQILYNQFFSEMEITKGMTEGYKKIRLESCLEDIFGYDLVGKEEDTYFLDDPIKEKVYDGFTLKGKFHKIAMKYFEKKSSESPIYEEEYHFQRTKYREARLIDHDTTQIYDMSTLVEPEDGNID
ncbi:MAG: hypothetical protein AYK19_10555 [Theionarchaea archaeon DG-70-1]|nr:MAG: hypothetical protein AYK19_10555 [Theionarchaea archaeon DG-70-1]